MKVKFKFIYIIFFIYLFNSFFFGQNKLTLDQCINLAFNNNEQLKIANLESKYYKESKKHLTKSLKQHLFIRRDNLIVSII